jgi:hypothetical protein
MIKELINKQVGEREKSLSEIQKNLKDGYKFGNIEAKFNDSEFEHCQTLRLDTGSFFDKNTFVSNMDIETAAELVYFIEHAMNK